MNKSQVIYQNPAVFLTRKSTLKQLHEENLKKCQANYDKHLTRICRLQDLLSKEEIKLMARLKELRLLEKVLSNK